MKNIIILIFCFLSLNSFAGATNVDVLSADFGVEDHKRQKTLCLTVVRVPQNGMLLGVVESIQACSCARLARRTNQYRIQMDLTKLRPFTVKALATHLQSRDGQLEFLFSPGE